MALWQNLESFLTSLYFCVKKQVFFLWFKPIIFLTFIFWLVLLLFSVWFFAPYRGMYWTSWTMICGSFKHKKTPPAWLGCSTSWLLTSSLKSWCHMAACQATNKELIASFQGNRGDGGGWSWCLLLGGGWGC